MVWHEWLRVLGGKKGLAHLGLVEGVFFAHIIAPFLLFWGLEHSVHFVGFIGFFLSWVFYSVVQSLPLDTRLKLVFCEGEGDFPDLITNNFQLITPFYLLHHQIIRRFVQVLRPALYDIQEGLHE